MKRTIVSIAVDTLVATVLIVAGFSIHAALAAPAWLLPPFAIPFLLYLRARLDPHRFSYGFIAVYVGLMALTFFVVDWFVPEAQREVAQFAALVVLVSLSSMTSRPKQRAA